METRRVVKNVSEQELPAVEIADRFKAKEHERSKMSKKAITKAHKMEKAKEMPDDLVGERDKMRAAILQLSLFPNLYNKLFLTANM